MMTLIKVIAFFILLFVFWLGIKMLIGTLNMFIPVLGIIVFIGAIVLAYKVVTK